MQFIVMHFQRCGIRQYSFMAKKTVLKYDLRLIAVYHQELPGLRHQNLILQNRNATVVDLHNAASIMVLSSSLLQTILEESVIKLQTIESRLDISSPVQCGNQRKVYLITLKLVFWLLDQANQKYAIPKINVLQNRYT